MSIQPVDTHQAASVQNRASEIIPAPSGQSHSQPGTMNAGDSVTLNKTIPTLPRFNNMQSDKAARNEIAGSINSVDSTMVEIGHKIDSMKADLEIIVKNFPPYPPGSEERIKFLRNFNSLRQQIDALTIPRPTEAGTIATKVQGLNTGPNGLNIPALADTLPEATDRQIYRAINYLDTARNTLDQSRAGLASEAATLIANG